MGAAIEGDATVLFSEGAMADPDDLPLRTALVEHAGMVVAHPSGQDRPLELGKGEREALEQIEDLIESRLAASTRPDAVPIHQESA